MEPDDPDEPEDDPLPNIPPLELPKGLFEFVGEVIDPPEPRLFVSVEEPPPSSAAFCFSCSIRGSYRNSHVSYVVCSFSTEIDSPLFELPIPTIAPPPPIALVAD